MPLSFAEKLAVTFEEQRLAREQPLIALQQSIEAMNQRLKLMSEKARLLEKYYPGYLGLSDRAHETYHLQLQKVIPGYDNMSLAEVDAALSNPAIRNAVIGPGYTETEHEIKKEEYAARREVIYKTAAVITGIAAAAIIPAGAVTAVKPLAVKSVAALEAAQEIAVQLQVPEEEPELPPLPELPELPSFIISPAIAVKPEPSIFVRLWNWLMGY